MNGECEGVVDVRSTVRNGAQDNVTCSFSRYIAY